MPGRARRRAAGRGKNGLGNLNRNPVRRSRAGLGPLGNSALRTGTALTPRSHPGDRQARSATIQGAGVERVILWGIREMRNGKIAALRCCLPERSDAQTARFIEWEEAHPSTGE